MSKDPFSLREEEIFRTLKELKGCHFVIIGGYAVNTYTLPRFSVDCDIVAGDKSELEKIEKILLLQGYKKGASSEGVPYAGSFSRYEKKLERGFTVSMDILIKSVLDRMTKVAFSAEWIFENSKIRILKGKTFSEELPLKIINIDALLVMKIISCRATNIRDVFMMLPHAESEEWIIKEISQRYNLRDRLSRIEKKVSSKQFKDGLSGVYGSFDQKTFEKHQKSIYILQKKSLSAY